MASTSRHDHTESELVFQAPIFSPLGSSTVPPRSPYSYSALNAVPTPSNDLHELPLVPLRYNPSYKSNDHPFQDSPQHSRYLRNRPPHLKLDQDQSSSSYDARSQPGTSAHSPLTGLTYLETPQAKFQASTPSLERKHPFASSFEAPNWSRLGVHVLLCLVAYPALFVSTLIAHDLPLFWTRFIVSAGCGIVGFVLGYSLVQLGKRFLAACAWATVIHQSRVPDAPGVRLKDLAANSEDPTSAWAALRLLWDRFMYTGTSRRMRAHYDKRPWSFYLMFFLLLVVVAGSMPFIFGRIITIDTDLMHQRKTYREIAIKGGLSESDIAKAAALNPAFENYALTWTLSPFSAHGGLPPAVSFSYAGDRVFFSETITNQLIANGSGFGTFDANTTTPSIDVDQVGTKQVGLPSDTLTATTPGSIIRFPKWGIRQKCVRLADPDLIVPRSFNGFTYVFIPHTVLQPLFSWFKMDYPRALLPVFNTTRVLKLNDTMPSGINPDSIALGGAFYGNGVAHSFFSTPIMPTDFNGWISLETVLVRLNNSYTPMGKFLKLGDQSEPDKDGNPTYVGYDAGICVELFEPYIVETYNSSFGPPSTIRIVEKSNVVRSQTIGKEAEKMIGAPFKGEAQTALNSSGLFGVYVTAHTNNINQMLKDNGRDADYVPSPTVVSYTGSSGPQGYTEFSADYFSQARSLADATNILPYFVGTGPTLARSYGDEVLTSARLRNLELAIALGTMLILGVIAALFVPRLPLEVPRRGFEIYSWMAAFEAEELVGTGRATWIEKNMDLKDIEGRVGELRFRHMG